MKALLENLGIDLKGRTSGEVKTICPKCSAERRNSKDPCLSVNVTEGIYNCHNCGYSGKVFEKRKMEYVKPQPRLEKVGKKVIEYMESRGISNNTLLRFGITESEGAICFNYFRDEVLVNIKFRAPGKVFRMVQGAELIFYNVDAIKDEAECVICEGEIDALSFHEAGVYNVVSVPNGASKGNQKLEYLDNCWSYFDKMQKVVLAVDSDDAGRSLRDELARRLGKEKCFTVSYPGECKDANEVLMKFSKDAVKELVQSAQEWPLEGIASMEDMYPAVLDYFTNGYPKGAASKIQGFDELLTFSPGQLTVITGIPGSGKDEFANLIMTNLAKHENWRWGVCGFEEPADITVTKLIEKFAGKAFANRRDQSHRINKEEFEAGVEFVHTYFSFISIQHIDVTMDGIISKATELVKRKGINGLIINPWNYIEHHIQRGQSETNYISEELTKLVNFLTKYNVHCFLIAHPTKIRKDEKTKKYNIPTLYDISGSAHFFNKTHNGLCVYRDFTSNTVDVYVQKVKWWWMGRIGYASFEFNLNTRQYISNKSNQFPSNWKPMEE